MYFGRLFLNVDVDDKLNFYTTLEKKQNMNRPVYNDKLNYSHILLLKFSIRFKPFEVWCKLQIMQRNPFDKIYRNRSMLKSEIL